MYLAQCVFSSLTAKKRQNNVKTAAKLRSFDASADCSLSQAPGMFGIAVKPLSIG